MKRLLDILRHGDGRSSLGLRLLVLLCVDAVACLVAASAAGLFDIPVFNVLVALTAAASAAASLPAARRWLEAPPAPAGSNPSLARTKKVLILAMVAGAIAYVGARGTFANFTAETANNGSSMTSGTLVLGNKVNTGTTCYSYTGATNDNVNGGCTALFTAPNMAPGVTTAQTKLTIQNDGSLDASLFYLSAPWPRTTLSTPLTQGVAPSQLVLSASVNAALPIGSTLLLSNSGKSQTYTVGSPGYAAGATTINLQAPALANYSYGAGTRVEVTSANTSAANTECFDTKTTNGSWPSSGSAPGSVLPFVSTTNNPLCAAMLFWVQEQTAGVNYCWQGRGAIGSPAPSANGQCRTPTTTSFGTGFSVTSGGSVTSITVAPLTGNIATGDVLTITQGTNTDTFKANGDAYIGDTTIPVKVNAVGAGAWVPNFSYTASATIKDTTAFDALNGDAIDTISNFDTSKRPNAPIQLFPLTTNTTAPNSSATVSLGQSGSTGTAGAQRVFYIGVYFPAPSGQAQNQLQGLTSQFGLSWRIEQ